jgi:hypothetical protein
VVSPAALTCIRSTRIVLSLMESFLQLP